MTKHALALLMLSSFILFACSPKQFRSDDPSDPTVHETKHTETTSYYYDFDDILVPRAMTLQTQKSFIFETPKVKGGLLTFTGRVDATSLASFFLNNMLKDGWKLRSSFKYRRTVLVFTKPDKDCIINIVDGRFTTHLEILIAPKSDAVTTAESFRQEPIRSETILTQ